MIEKLTGKATETDPAYNEDIGNNLEEGRGIILAVGRQCIKDQSASLWQGTGWQSQVATPSFFCPRVCSFSLFTHLCLVLLETLGPSQAQSESLSIMGCFYILPPWDILLAAPSSIPPRFLSGLQPSSFLSHGMFQRLPSLCELTR